jgi:hypothetical protein
MRAVDGSTIRGRQRQQNVFIAKVACNPLESLKRRSEMVGFRGAERMSNTY